MTRKAEVYRFGERIPVGLAEKLTIPSYIPSSGHPLRHFVCQSLTPTDLDIVLLEDFNGFYQRLTGHPFGVLLKCHGLYMAKDHAWSQNGHYKKANEALMIEYGINVYRALLLPLERVDYWTMIHEALHDVFNHLSMEQRATIISSAKDSYDTLDRLNGMLHMTHLNISNFSWNHDEIARIMKENEMAKKSPLDGFDNFYTFGNLNPADQLQVVDEFISGFYTHRRKDRWSAKHLHPKFRETLKNVGYNMTNPPEVEND